MQEPAPDPHAQVQIAAMLSPRDPILLQGGQEEAVLSWDPGNLVLVQRVKEVAVLSLCDPILVQGEQEGVMPSPPNPIPGARWVGVGSAKSPESNPRGQEWAVLGNWDTILGSRG